MFIKIQIFYQKGASLLEDDGSWSSWTNSPGKLLPGYETWWIIEPLEKSHRIIFNCKNTVELFSIEFFFLKKSIHVFKIIYECIHSIIQLFNTVRIFHYVCVGFFPVIFLWIIFFHLFYCCLIDRNKFFLRLSWKNFVYLR